jgi:hypothetical protein
MANPIYLPSNGPESWRVLLGDPVKHWREGYSARCTAESWELADGLPKEIAAALQNAGLSELELLLAFPEWKTPLPARGGDSQTDIMAMVKTDQGVFMVGVEAKVAESFDKTVERWLHNASDGKRKRLEYLKSMLGLEGDIGHLRYQLLHRTVAAMIEADRFGCAGAAMIVQSFSPTNAWKEDFDLLARAIGHEPGRIGQRPNGTPLLLAWAKGPSSYQGPSRHQ